MRSMMKKSEGTPVYVQECLDIIGLREIARKHIEQITATDSLTPLPHELLSTDTQSTGLASLVEILDLSDSNEDRQKVRLWDLRNGKYDLTGLLIVV
jgi:hypothetical protein